MMHPHEFIVATNQKLDLRDPRPSRDQRSVAEVVVAPGSREDLCVPMPIRHAKLTG